MDYKNFEENMASKLRNAEVYVDTDALINAIHPLEDKKRRGIWFSLAGLLILAFIPYYLYFGNSNSVNSKFTNSDMIDCELQIPSIKNKNEIKNTDINDIETDENFKIVNTSNKKTNSILKKKPIFTKDIKGLTDNILKENIISSNQQIQKTSKSNITLNPLKYSNIKQLLIDENEKLPTKNHPTVECPSFSGPKWLPSIGVHAGVFYPFKQLNNSSNEQSIIFQNRLDNEKPLEGLNGGLFLQVENARFPLYLKLGVDYSKMTERLKLETSVVKMDTTQGIISITESENGDTLTVIRGDIITEKTINTKSVTHYTIQMVDLPINLGYKFRTNNFNFAIESGICINLLTKTQGRILNQIDQINAIADNDGFKKKLGLSYFGNFVIEKPLNFGAISLNLRYRFIPGDFSTSSIAQYYRFGGINLAYRIGF